jgi:hypothetical protein
MTGDIFRSEIWIKFRSVKKQKLIYMKHIQFTLQFVILLVAIPLLVFMQFRHDNTNNAKAKTQTESATAYTKQPPVSGDVLSFN